MTREIRANCPECGKEVDGATDPKDPTSQPEEGDLGICIYCAGVGFYVIQEDGTLGLRLATVEEKVGLSEDADVTKVRAAIAAQSVWFKP